MAKQKFVRGFVGSLTLCTILALGAIGGGQKPPPKALATYVIPPADITSNPLVFSKGQTVSFSASLIAPQKCTEGAIGIRIYNVDENTAEPKIDTSFLLSSGSGYDFSSAPGSKVPVNFDSLSIPAGAGSKLYVVVWNLCTVMIPKDIDPTGHIIWDRETVGFEMGGANYRFDCGEGGKVNSRCLYRKD